MRNAKPLFAAVLVVVCLISGSACRVKKPPSRDNIHKDALPNYALTEPWKAPGAIMGPVQDDWLAQFNDPQLTALVKEAVANNPDLRLASLRVDEAEQYVKAAKGKLLPVIGAAGRHSTKLGQDLGTGLSGGIFAISWEIDLWGKLRYARNATQETYVATVAEEEFARQSIAAATANAWFTAAETKVHLEIAKEMVATSEQLVLLSDKRLTVGVGTERDVLLARTSLNNYRDVVEQLELALADALRALESLLGRYPGAEIQARTDLPQMPGPVPAGIPLEILERRPDMFAAERRVAAAFNRVGEARAARLPSISLTGTGGYITSSSLQLKPDFTNPVGGIVASILAPIYQGGQLKAQVKVREIQQKQAVADYARLALRAIGDVEGAIHATHTLERRREILAALVVDSRRTLEIEQVAFRIGTVDLRTVQQQQLALFGARVTLLRVQSEQLMQRVNLYLALGVRYEK